MALPFVSPRWLLLRFVYVWFLYCAGRWTRGYPDSFQSCSPWACPIIPSSISSNDPSIVFYDNSYNRLLCGTTLLLLLVRAASPLLVLLVALHIYTRRRTSTYTNRLSFIFLHIVLHHGPKELKVISRSQYDNIFLCIRLVYRIIGTSKYATARKRTYQFYFTTFFPFYYCYYFETH